MENSEFYLGIETSGHAGSIALAGPGSQIDQVDLQKQGRKHAQTLVAEVKTLLDRFKILPDQIRGIGVSRGPGSFTGLRIGATFAKTFGYVTGCPVLGIDTFEAVALNSPAEVESTWVISNAQRGDLFVGKYLQTSDNQWKQVSEIRVCEMTEFSQSLPPGECISGPGIELLEPAELGHVRLLEPPFRLPVARNIAAITARILQTSAPDQLNSLDEKWSLAPFYLRKSAAEEKWEARQQSDSASS